MKQIALSMGSGKLAVKDVPPPVLKDGAVLVAVRASLISSGTERGKLQTARRSLLGKARARPDQVRQVLAKVREQGLMEAVAIVKNRLARDEPLGYSCAGEVLAVGVGVTGIRPGDRVACAGAGNANHAEVVVVPRHLCVPVPGGVTWEQASFVTLGAIALHAVRMADVRLGDRVLVVGLGLVGQLCAQLIAASGGVPAGTDLNPALEPVTRASGVNHLAFGEAMAQRLVDTATSGVGFDAVIVAASDGGGSAFAGAIRSVRDRGRVVVVGAVGIDVPNVIKSELFEREVDVRFARSYGPGRYDPSYEEEGNDYPIGYVRWTEGRNLGAVLEAIAMGRLMTDHLISGTFDISEAPAAFERLDTPGPDPVLGLVLTYERPLADRLVPVQSRSRRVLPSTGSRTVNVGVIGAGNFAQAQLLPHLMSDTRVKLKSVVTGSGLSADHVMSNFGFEEGHGDPAALFDDPALDAILIATRHDAHADLVCAALKAGKHVFVEKPLALNREELARVALARETAAGTLAVGFNRRFSSMIQEVVSHRDRENALFIQYRIHAGPLPRDSWYAGSAQGGRFIGEGGHFIDTVCVLAGSPVVTVFASETSRDSASPRTQDSLTTVLKHADGSVSSISYLANGDTSVPKERLEVFGGGQTWVLEDFRSLVRHTGRRRRRVPVAAGKGHAEEMKSWVDGLMAGETWEDPDPLHVTDVTLAVVESLAAGHAVEIPHQAGG